MPKISVIVPVYNLEKEIKRCILSLVFQKFTDFEIIAIDDGSNDNSPLILDEMAEKWHDLIRVFHRKNHGLSATRNFGIKKARGEFISFIDGDDFVDPYFLEKLHTAIFRDNSDIAVSGYNEFHDDKLKVFSKKAQTMSGFLATKILLTQQENLDVVCWNKLYRKKLFDTVQFPEGENHEDNLTTYKLLFLANKVSYISDALYNYERRDTSITKSEDVISRLNAKLTAARAAKKFLKKTDLFEAAEFSEILAYFQFIDFSLRHRIDQKYFSIYRKKVLGSKIKLDFKRNFYKALLIPCAGIFYKIFRKLVK